MRTISLTATAAFNAEQTGEKEVFLVTITHTSLPDPLRYTSDPTTRFSVDPLVYGTTSRGHDYEFLPLSLQLPDDSEDTPPSLRLFLDNVTRQAVPLLRSVATPALVTVEMVLRSAPDTVEMSLPEFELVTADYDAAQVSLDLVMNALATEPYPAGLMTPTYFPGAF